MRLRGLARTIGLHIAGRATSGAGPKLKFNPIRLFVMLAISAVLVGTLGFVFFEEYIYPDPQLLAATVCCLPAAGIALLLLLFAVFLTRLRSVRVKSPTKAMRDALQGKAQGGRSGLGGRVDRNALEERAQELEKKRESLRSLLESLAEQHDSGLLLDQPYRRLKAKYEREAVAVDEELSLIRQQLSQTGSQARDRQQPGRPPT